jgi:hypothetical protein
VREDTVDSIMEMADRTNAWQLCAVCRHFLRNRGDRGLGLVANGGGNGQNGGGDGMEEDGEDDDVEDIEDDI